MSKTGQSTTDRLREIFRNHLGHDEKNITDQASIIDDLGADSLDLVELVMAVEEEFDLEISDDDAEKILTFGDAVAYVEART